MDNLENLAIKVVRENWNIYLDIPEFFVDFAWNDWYKKFNIDENDFYIKLFRDFIMNKEILKSNTICIENNILILKGLDNIERKEIHKLCDNIGLHHVSILTKKNKKHLHIIKPSIWLWEFSEKNPYSELPEVYENREKRRNQKLMNKCCYNCGLNALECDLFHSVYIRGTYCLDCLETMSDGDGNTLNDHKFEPIYY